MNTTIVVGSFYECNLLDKYSKSVNVYEPIWRHTINGCKILQILQDMYNFSISYVHEDPELNISALEAGGELRIKSQVDVYLRPMNFRPEFLDFIKPIHVAYVWRYGFLLRRSETTTLRTFYSQPFSRPVWNCLYGMALFVSVFFYLLKRWERRVVGGYECSFTHEILMVIGAYCQHIPPIDPILPSRRIAYFIFFLFSYLVFTFYTSNLLSDLVNLEDQIYDLAMLGQSDYDFVYPDYINPNMMASQFSIYNHNYSMIVNKWDKMKSMTAPECLERLRRGKTAVLSDYTSISHLIQRTFEGNDICSLVNVDLFSNIEKYFFTSKKFRFIEKTKIGIMRASETGILKRLIGSNAEVIYCAPSHLVNTRLLQISTPLIVMMFTYVLSMVILVAERIHYKRNYVFPYRN